MPKSSLRVVLDACVIFSTVLRDTFLRAAEAEFYEVLWSEAILEEVRRNLIESGRTTEEQAQKLIETMDRFFPTAKLGCSRSYECFKYLHLGIISTIKKKSLPEIAKVIGWKSSQSLHHFLAVSPWSVEELRNRRLGTILKALNSRAIQVVIDETGDRKKGKKTDYVARQYLGEALVKLTEES